MVAVVQEGLQRLDADAHSDEHELGAQDHPVERVLLAHEATQLDLLDVVSCVRCACFCVYVLLAIVFWIMIRSEFRIGKKASTRYRVHISESLAQKRLSPI